MRKLKLDLDKLDVESFDTLTGGPAQRGTIVAFSHICVIDTYSPATCMATCGSCPGATCAFTCGDTCNYTCDDASCISCLTNCNQASCVEVCP